MSENLAVLFVLYPDVTQLDFTGPAQVLSRLPGATLLYASPAGGAVMTDCGFAVADTVPLRGVERCDLLCVPGGAGSEAMCKNDEALADIRRLAETARYTTSVCTGSLILGAAGLLKGRRAASHWAWRHMLAIFGAIPDPGRVVRDGNIFTGGGVTAGIDFGLAVAAEIADENIAKAIQLSIEYAPAPPFSCGRPEDAPANIREKVERSIEPRRVRLRAHFEGSSTEAS